MYLVSPYLYTPCLVLITSFLFWALSCAWLGPKMIDDPQETQVRTGACCSTGKGMYIAPYILGIFDEAANLTLLVHCSPVLGTNYSEYE